MTIFLDLIIVSLDKLNDEEKSLKKKDRISKRHWDLNKINHLFWVLFNNSLK